jgi:hypothetical protein
MDRNDASALADLQMHWDEAYVIGLDGDIWSARYRTSADELRAHTAYELRELIRSDYAYRQKADLTIEEPDEDEDAELDDTRDRRPPAGDPLRSDGDQPDDDDAAGEGPEVGVSFRALHGERMST